MLNYIWGFMILTGILYGSITGNISLVSEAILSSAKDAVTLCFTMLGIMSFWTGMMEIATTAGVVDSIRKRLVPMLLPLFPGIPQQHEAWEDISMNIVANILGLGWAATPAGLRAMEKMAKLFQKEYASDAVCSFLIINISSLQLIPVNVVLYRSQYGSVNPARIIVPAMIATTITTAVGILFCYIMIRINQRRRK